MYHTLKIRVALALGLSIFVTFLIVIGYSVGQQSQKKLNDTAIQTAAKELKEKEETSQKGTVLTVDTVKEFLTQYYTKERLGENNQRIAPYMTESAYNEELARQEEAINQVYKDYILDYRFESATIYINEADKEVLATVRYTVTYVSDLAHVDQAQTNQVEEKTIELGYATVNDQLLVNHLQVWDKTLLELTRGEGAE